VVFFVFAYFFFLETKGYTMEEVGMVFDGKSRSEIQTQVQYGEQEVPYGEHEDTKAAAAHREVK
jgi:hypothetical protein